MVIHRRPHCSADLGGRAAPACRVEHEVAGIGGHEDAALDDLRVGLDYVNLRVSESGTAVSIPDVCRSERPRKSSR